MHWLPCRAVLPPPATRPPPAWKFMCSPCCGGVWRLRTRRIMRSSLRFSSPSSGGGRGRVGAAVRGLTEAVRKAPCKRLAASSSTSHCLLTWLPCPPRAPTHPGSPPRCSAPPARRRCGGRAPARGRPVGCPGCRGRVGGCMGWVCFMIRVRETAERPKPEWHQTMLGGQRALPVQGGRRVCTSPAALSQNTILPAPPHLNTKRMMSLSVAREPSPMGGGSRRSRCSRSCRRRDHQGRGGKMGVEGGEGGSSPRHRSDDGGDTSCPAAKGRSAALHPASPLPCPRPAPPRLGVDAVGAVVVLGPQLAKVLQVLRRERPGRRVLDALKRLCGRAAGGTGNGP